MKIVKNIIAVTFIMFSVMACGGGGGGGATITISDVSGTYSFITDTTTYTCTDGGSGTSTAIASTATVSQSGHSLTITSDKTFDSTTVTILSDTGTTGTIEDSGHFVTNRNAEATVTGIENPVLLSVTLDGDFTDSSWSGTWTEKISITSPVIGSCTYTASFRGDKN